MEAGEADARDGPDLMDPAPSADLEDLRQNPDSRTTNDDQRTTL
jgi:hypothetical protein